MLMFDRKIQKNCGSVRVTTCEFVFSVSKSIDLCKLKVDPEWGQRNLFSKRLLGSQNTVSGVGLIYSGEYDACDVTLSI